MVGSGVTFARFMRLFCRRCRKWFPPRKLVEIHLVVFGDCLPVELNLVVQPIKPVASRVNVLHTFQHTVDLGLKRFNRVNSYGVASPAVPPSNGHRSPGCYRLYPVQFLVAVVNEGEELLDLAFGFGLFRRFFSSAVAFVVPRSSGRT
jgi:hypothetical protein